MRRTLLTGELFDPDDGEGGYLKVEVLLLPDNNLKGHAWIPGLGRKLIEKRMYQYPESHVSFAWHLEREAK